MMDESGQEHGSFFFKYNYKLDNSCMHLLVKIIEVCAQCVFL